MMSIIKQFFKRIKKRGALTTSELIGLMVMLLLLVFIIYFLVTGNSEGNNLIKRIFGR